MNTIRNYANKDYITVLFYVEYVSNGGETKHYTALHGKKYSELHTM